VLRQGVRKKRGSGEGMVEGREWERERRRARERESVRVG